MLKGFIPSSGAGWSEDPEPRAHEEGHSEVTSSKEPRYRLGALLGVGGMGRVYAAHDRLLDRTVALKVVASDRATPQALAAMLGEARITAALDHPAIVPIFDAGRLPDGQPFYTMAIITGRTLAAALSQPTLAERLRLLPSLLAASQGAAWAHRHGIVHCDLTANNVILGDLGEARIADWGLARRVGAPTTGAGTPGFLSPEQQVGAAADPAMDVYALGCSLHALLRGTPTGEAPRPPPELEAIAARAAAEDPAARYPTAADLAADLAAFIDGRRVAAYSYSRGELLRRAVQAWRAPLVVAALAAVLLATGGTIAVRRTLAERDRATAAEGLAQGQLGRALEAQALAAWRSGAEPEAEVLAAQALLRGESPAARGLLAGIGEVRPRRRAWRDTPPCEGAMVQGELLLCMAADEVSVWPLGGAQARWRAPGTHHDALLLPDGRVVLTEPADRLVVRAADGSILQTLTGLPGSRGLRLGAGEVLLGNGDGLARYDLETGALSVQTPCPDGVFAMRTVSVGRAVVVICKGHRPAIIDDGPPRWLGAIPGEAIDAIALEADGDAVLLGSAQGTLVRLPLDGSPAEPPIQVSAHALQELATIGPGLVATLDDRGRVRLVDLHAAAIVGSLPGRVLGIDASGPLSLTTIGSRVDTWTWDAAPRRSVFTGPHGITGVLVESGLLSTVDGGGMVRSWSLPDGALRFEEQWWQGVVAKGLARLQSGRLLVVAAGAPAALSGGPGLGREPHLDSISALRRVAVLADDEILGMAYMPLLKRADPAGPLSDLSLSSPVFDVAVSEDRAAAVWVDEAGDIWRYPAAGTPRRLVHQPETRALALLPDGGLLLATTDQVEVRDPDGALRRTIPFSGAPPVDITAAGDGLAVVGQRDGRCRVLDLETGALLAILTGHEARVSTLASDGDGQLFTGSWDGSVRRWDLSRLRIPASELVATAATWGITLDEALAAGE